MKNSTNGSTNNSKRDTSALRNHPWPHPSSLWERRMANYDRHKTIDTSTQEPYSTSTPYHGFKNLSIALRPRNFLPNSMYVGDTTTFASRKATNGRPPSEQAEDYLNPPSCFSASPTPQQHSKT